MKLPNNKLFSFDKNISDSQLFLLKKAFLNVDRLYVHI